MTDHVMSPEELVQARIEALRQEHRALDAALDSERAARVPCVFTLQRLKREKLALKDRIAKLADQLIPDIIA